MKINWIHRAGFSCSGFMISVLLAGCGGEPPKATVTGKVTYKGKTLTMGTVTFMGDGTTALASAAISPEGKYTIKIVPGPVKITVLVPTVVQPPANIKMDPGKFGSEVKKANAVKEPEPIRIPGHYADYKKTPLTFTVKAGPQEYEVKLD